jgi:hypothetical protein
MNSLTSQKLKAIFQSKTSTKENPDQYFLECWEFPNGLVMLDVDILPDLKVRGFL